VIQCCGRWLVMDGTGPERVWVQVIDVDVAADREVTFGRNLAQELSDRAGDIRGAIETGSASVAKSLPSLGAPEGWQLGEVSASFGITLTAEAGVIVSKASAGRPSRFRSSSPERTGRHRWPGRWAGCWWAARTAGRASPSLPGW